MLKDKVSFCFEANRQTMIFLFCFAIIIIVIII
jgi:hypothetical protein